MPHLNRNGVELYYDVHGEGPALLLTHGYGASSHMWAGQVAPFAKHVRLITWDMRGHGRSASPDNPALYSEEATVADMAALLEAVGAESAIIGGLSLGGYMSLAFHLTHPTRTRALLIIDTGPGFKNDEAREGWNERARMTGEKWESDGLARLAKGGAEQREAPHTSAKGLANAARGMLAQRDARVINSLPEIAVPSLVVVGARDEPFLKASDYMAAKIPGAKKLVIPDAGHAANIDQPELFNDAILSFLADAKLMS
ncbi:MAG: alpha/beta fold hydrolase [Rhizomicrobium sp.]|jgi:pimeloyl-ACP methyl ester carboxylesterase